MIKINLLLIILLLLASCSSLKDAGKVIRNEKKASTDEFLIKKREPLVIPPNHSKIPKPDDGLKNKVSEEEQIKKILKSPKEKKTSIDNNSTVEKSILNRIRK
jgi:hypothetical protein